MRQYHSPYVGMGNDPGNLTDPTGGRAEPPTEDGAIGDIEYGTNGTVDNTGDRFYMSESGWLQLTTNEAVVIGHRPSNNVGHYNPQMNLNSAPNNLNKDLGARISDLAKGYVGTDKRSYGTGKGQIDCSGFTREVAKKAGKSLEGTAYDQAAWFRKNGIWSTKLSDAKKGDFIYWKRGEGKYHAGIVTQVEGGIRVVNTFSSKTPTIKLGSALDANGQQPYWGQPFVGIGRFK